MQDINAALEVFYYAHRAIIARPDAILAKYGLSRVHHRILYFIGRNPELSVNDLLSKLGVSKQSLNAPMRKLLELGFIVSTPDLADRRVKRLTLSDIGKKLEKKLTEDQKRRFAKAFSKIEKKGELSWLSVMKILTED